MRQRAELKGSKRWVVKIGSALLTGNGRGLDRERLSEWVDQMAALRNELRDRRDLRVVFDPVRGGVIRLAMRVHAQPHRIGRRGESRRTG